MKNSYTSAEIDIPVKIIHDDRLLKSISELKFIYMRHLQLIPTNKCNLNCEYCSCKDRDKTEEMPLLDVIKLLDTAVGCGCKAVTITGGGEPLLHPHINEIIEACRARYIKVGLVTNGLALDKLKTHVDWCRISFDSHRQFKPLANSLNRALKKLRYEPPIDWAFSFVAYNGVGELKRLVRYANINKFTHVRVVGDILNPSIEIINACKRKLQDMDKRVIYQPRQNYTKGRAKCWISMLKPTIAADGTIYPCCGAQYAMKGSKRDYHGAFGMGKDLKEVITKQQVFDGSVCEVCYYDNYNRFLGLLMEDIKHVSWV